MSAEATFLFILLGMSTLFFAYMAQKENHRANRSEDNLKTISQKRSEILEMASVPQWNEENVGLIKRFLQSDPGKALIGRQRVFGMSMASGAGTKGLDDRGLSAADRAYQAAGFLEAARHLESLSAVPTASEQTPAHQENEALVEMLKKYAS